MKEKDFQAEIARSIPWLCETLRTYIAYTKIPDAPKGPEQRFSARKGYDCFLVHCGRHLAIELKLSKGMSWSFDALDDYQEAKLLEVERAGGRAWVVVSFRVAFAAKEAKKRGLDQAILAFGLPVEHLIAVRAEAVRKSLPLDWFEANAVALPRIPTTRGAGWDLRPVLGVV